jgi:hypothetical protein
MVLENHRSLSTIFVVLCDDGLFCQDRMDRPFGEDMFSQVSSDDTA